MPSGWPPRRRPARAVPGNTHPVTTGRAQQPVLVTCSDHAMRDVPGLARRRTSPRLYAISGVQSRHLAQQSSTNAPRLSGRPGVSGCPRYGQPPSAGSTSRSSSTQVPRWRYGGTRFAISRRYSNPRAYSGMYAPGGWILTPGQENRSCYVATSLPGSRSRTARGSFSTRPGAGSLWSSATASATPGMTAGWRGCSSGGPAPIMCQLCSCFRSGSGGAARLPLLQYRSWPANRRWRTAASRSATGTWQILVLPSATTTVTSLRARMVCPSRC